MTREEAIRIIDPETTCNALGEIEYFGGFSGEWARSIALCEALSMAAAALREQETKCVEIDTVKPLTLDELREMDGEPVWIRAKHYGIYADIVNIMGKEDGERRVHFSINYRLQENGCGKTWLAYRSEPKEV